MMAGFRVAHTGDIHVEEDRYFRDTAECVEWYVGDAVRAKVNLFVVDGDLTTYKQTIEERKFWIDTLIRMAEHAPVLLVAGNHGKELEGDLYPLARAKGKHVIYLSTAPEFLEIAGACIATFPYPVKANLLGTPHEQSLQQAFAQQLEEFNERFRRRTGQYRLFFGHFGVAGARVSSGQPLAGRCAEYPLEPLRSLQAQYVGLSHVHLRQQLTPRVWYAGSLSRCDYSETEDKGYHLVALKEPEIRPDLSDMEIDFRKSPTRGMVELEAEYRDGDFHFKSPLDTASLKNSRVKVVITAGAGVHESLGRDEQERLRQQLLRANPAELKLKIEHEAETSIEPGLVSRARSAEGKLRVYWKLKGGPPAEQQERLLARLAQVEQALLAGDDAR